MSLNRRDLLLRSAGLASLAAFGLDAQLGAEAPSSAAPGGTCRPNRSLELWLLETGSGQLSAATREGVRACLAGG